MPTFSLDHLYKMTVHVYAEQNFHRPISATFLHFVEVCGMLTANARKKKRESFSFEDSLCKALGWFFPLMAKCGVISIERMVFRKFPYVCPYCRKSPHSDIDCKVVRGTDTTVNHLALRKILGEHKSKMPHGLNDWQKMFQELYPRNIDTSRSAIGLMEELGELAEAIRVFERHPKFLAGEAADVFSYIMGLANEYSIQKAMQGDPPFDFEHEFLKRYPGICLACGNPVCTCPSVPQATIGRMAKELEIEEDENLFSPHWHNDDGAAIANKMLSSAGGLDSIVSSIPLDKGQISNSMILLCHRLADAIREFDSSLSNTLKDCAQSIATNQTNAGSQHSIGTRHDVVKVLADAFKLAVSNNKTITEVPADSLAFSLIESASRFRILMIGVSALGDDRLNVEKELREVKSAIERSSMRDLIEVDSIMGCTINDLRRTLLSKEFNFLHFFGHGFDGGIVFSTNDSEPHDVQIDAIRSLINLHPSIRGILINSCESLKNVDAPIGAFTIGMNDEIDDEVAISFAVGFYDALCTGFSIQRAIEEGKNNVTLHHNNCDLPLKVLAT